MVNKIKKKLVNFIGNLQKGFVPGWQILDVVITTHEIIHSMEKIRRPDMVLQLNISKAYDRVNWTVLYDMLEQVGFIEDIVHVIRNMVEIAQYEVLLNGTPWGTFEASRGLTQDNPLSPYLFIMVLEVLR